MVFREWDILVVDDEPDVLAATELVLKNLTVYGLPLRVLTANSKAEAIEVLKKAQWPNSSGITVAFIDVVMENDQAGLELCQFIRESGNQLTQVFVRTGQPGVAPERDVIDKFDINGYFTKVEATEDKLYTLVKSGVRQYWWAVWSMSVMGVQQLLLNSMESKETVRQNYVYFTDTYKDDELQFYVRIEDETIYLHNWSEDEAKAKEAELRQLPSAPLPNEGDIAVANDDKFHLYSTVARPGVASVAVMFSGILKSPPALNMMYNNIALGLGTAYAKAP